ncbi:MAG: type II secretion system F family protein [Acidobacteria bacterium]|nr:type II secretion system F family protein [Acidobacteriota bacterium]
MSLRAATRARRPRAGRARLSRPRARLSRPRARLSWPRALRDRATARAEPGREADLLARCGRQAALGLVAGAALLPGRAVVAAVAGAALGWRLAEEGARRAAEREARATDRALADVLDLMVACVLAGMSPERALRLIAPAEEGRLGEAIRAAVGTLDLGAPRAEAYAILAERAGGREAARLAACLERAERFGTPVSRALGSHARDVRARARAEAEAEARTAPVRLLFPLGLCFLPAFVLLTIVPLVLSAIRSLRGI